MVFHGLYKANKENISTYGCYIDTPYLINEYFNVLDTELMRRDKDKKDNLDRAKDFIKKVRPSNG